MINENIALAKSILNKVNIKQDSEEYKDYLKIREICGSNVGYVGILTRIRFIDNVTDIDELTSIFNAFKESKMDIAKINKLSYDEILDVFYDKIFNKTNKDYEIVYSDNEYTYYKVYTYNGILKLSSPSWCLKTKSNYDKYMELYDTQYIVIQNKYKNRIITPNDSYITNYSSSKGFIRYGFTLRSNNDTVNWVGFDDNNANIICNTDRYTSFGVLCTILNLEGDKKESYYDNFYGCERVSGTSFLKVVDKEKFTNRLRIDNLFDDSDTIYALFSKTYSYFPVLLVLNNYYPYIFILTSKDHESFSKNDFRLLKTPSTINFFEKYAIESNNIIYLGVKIKKGIITVDNAIQDKRFIKSVDKWLIFDRNESFYVVINSNPDYILPTSILKYSEKYHYIDNPMFFFINKKTLKVHKLSEYNKGDVYDTIIESLKEKKKGILDFLNFKS